MKTELLALPLTQSLMTGVLWIEKRGDTLTLVYTDGSRESAVVKVVKIADGSDAFSIISLVQQERDGQGSEK